MHYPTTGGRRFGSRRLLDLTRACRHRLAARLGHVPRTLSVQLQTTSACNGRCVFCPYVGSWAQEHPGSMDDALFAKIVADLKNYRIRKLCLFLENEPLMDPRLIDRVRLARRELRFNLLEIATNASPLTTARADELADALAGTPHEVWISFHGASKESYEAVMGLDFDRTLANVVHLLRLAESRDLHVVIRGAGVAVDAARDHAPTHFSESEYRAFWDRVFREHNIRRPPRVEFFAYHDRAGSIGRGDYDFGVRRASLKGFYCYRLDSWLHVLYNGDVVICCNDYHREEVLGNLNGQTIREVFKSETYRTMLRRGLGMEPAPDDFICKRCSRPGG